GGAAASGAVAAVAIAVQGHDPGPSLVEHSVVRDNVLTLVAPNGEATAFGGGLTNDANTLLDDVRVRGNRVEARSLTASLQGGGIWNGRLPDPTAAPAATPTAPPPP